MAANVEAKAPVETSRLSSAGRERFTAFLSDESSEKVVRQCVTDLALPFSSVHRGGIARAISHLSTDRSPTVLMVDVSGVELPVSEMHHLAEVCEPGVAVIVVGDRNDVGLYRDLMQAGVSDYIVKPLTRALVQAAVQPLLDSGSTPSAAAPLSQKLGRVVSVVGARGGVGGTTVAANLAWYLANTESRRVALVDLDLHYGDAALMLDVKIGGGLREVLENPQRVDELFLDRAMTRSGERLYVLAGEEKLDLPLRLDPNAVEPLIGLLRKQFHYVIIDAPRQHEVFLRQVLDASGVRIIVADQTARSVRDTLRLRQFLDSPQPGQRNVLVVNRVGEQGKSGIEIKDLSATIGLAVDVTIPFDPKSALSAANAGLPVVGSKGRLTTAIIEIAEELSGRRTAAASGSRWKVWK
jgi:pilus assembly protein CpaE